MSNSGRLSGRIPLGQPTCRRVFERVTAALGLDYHVVVGVFHVKHPSLHVVRWTPAALDAASLAHARGRYAASEQSPLLLHRARQCLPPRIGDGLGVLVVMFHVKHQNETAVLVCGEVSGTLEHVDRLIAACSR